MTRLRAWRYADRMPDNAPNFHRRKFLQFSLAAAGVGFAAPALARFGEEGRPDRLLKLYNTHTGESLQTTYWSEGNYVASSLDAVNHILRDHRTDQVARIDTDLLDVLYKLTISLSSAQAFHIISGYRSPLTNARLAAESNGVAKHSMHLDGRAVDIRLPQRDLGVLHAAALKLKAGGVGFYEKSNFVHLDTGRVRNWG